VQDARDAAVAKATATAAAQRFREEAVEVWPILPNT
jgi:hypothetical protein